MMSQYETLGGEGSVVTFATRDGYGYGTPRGGGAVGGGHHDEDTIRFYHDEEAEEVSDGGGYYRREEGSSSEAFPIQKAAAAAAAAVSPSSQSSLPNAAPSLSFDDVEEGDAKVHPAVDEGHSDAGSGGKCLDVTIDPAGFSGRADDEGSSDFGPPADLLDDDEDDDEPSFLRRARASPPSSEVGSGSGSGVGRGGGVRRSRRPWDELKDESTGTDLDRDRSLMQRRGMGQSFVTVNVTREGGGSSDGGTWRGSETGSNVDGNGAGGGVILGRDAVEPTPIRPHSSSAAAEAPASPPSPNRGRTPSPAPSWPWDRSDEATPLLSNPHAAANGGDDDGTRPFGRSNTPAYSLSEAASSWATGASMRFRDPLHRRRDFAPDANAGASPSWSGGIVNDKEAAGQRQRRAGGGANDDDASKYRRGAGFLAKARGAAASVWNVFFGRMNRGGVVVGTAAGCGGCETFFDMLRREDMATMAAAASSAKSGGPLRPRFSRLLFALWIVHFGAAGLFDLVLLIRAAVTNGGYEAPPFWLSSDGLARNPLIGPSSSTLAQFGAASPALVLLLSQSWRLIASVTLSTSLVQILINLYAARSVVAELERRVGPSSVAGLYAASALVGGVWSVALPLGVPEGGTAEPTGLAGAGTTGLLAACLVEMGLGTWRERRRRRRRLWQLPRPGLAHALLLLSFLPCPFPHGSLSAALGGAVAGLGCGAFLFASLARGGRRGGADGGGNDGDDEDRNDDWGGRSESLFEPVGTPERRRPNNYRTPDAPPSPPPPPDTSPSASRGMTPRMRRSILASPGAGASGSADEERAFGFADASSPVRDDWDDENENGAAVASAPADRRRNGAVPFLRFAGLALALAGAALPPLLLAAGAVRPIGAAEEGTVLGELRGGCRYLRRLHPEADVEQADDAEGGYGGDGWVCSESCVPLGLERRAAGRRTWASSSQAASSSSTASSWGVVRAGRCADLGYRCGPTASYELYLVSSKGPRSDAEVYIPPGSDGTCQGG